MAMSTTDIANELRPGLAAITGDYPNYPTEWSQLFETYDSDKAFEIETEMRFLGPAQIRAEGAQSAVDIMGQRSVTTYLHRYVSLVFAITRQARMDNLYESKFPLVAKAFKRSFLIAKETLGAAVFNNGTSANYPGGDGQPLFSVNHPIDAGVYANKLAANADLNEASLESALIGISGFPDVAGNITATKGKKLVVPRQLDYVACRLTESQFRTNTPNNDISAIYNMKSLPEGYMVNHYLSSSTFWMVLTDAPDGLKHFAREPFETDAYVEFSTDNIMCKGLERYSFGWTNPRGVYLGST
jgi:hypothetical protein